VADKTALYLSEYIDTSFAIALQAAVAAWIAAR
jgi:hypothetical protein